MLKIREEIMTNKEEAKKKDIIEFIRLALLQPEYLGPASSIWVEQAIAASGKDMDTEEINASVQERTLDDGFIKRFTSSFDEIFSHEEIKELISFYQSESMKKNVKEGPKLFSPMYDAYRLVVQEVLAQ
jgi:hypothetical protein